MQESTAPSDIATLRVARPRHGRGWIVRRALAAADIAGLCAAFAFTELLFSDPGRVDDLAPRTETLLLALTLPAWIVIARLYGLYDRDETHADHSTVDDLVRVFHLLTLGAWIVWLGTTLTGFANPDAMKIGTFWLTAIVGVTLARSAARSVVRRTRGYVQRTGIVGGDEVARQLARKIVRHPEYGMELVGVIDTEAKALSLDDREIPCLGPPHLVASVVEEQHLDRIIFAFPDEPDEKLLEQVRLLQDHDVQVDLVPRLPELVGPGVAFFAIEALPIAALSKGPVNRSALFLKRLVDVSVSSVLILVTAPLFAFVAWRIRRTSEGPVFFRQERLGRHRHPFTMLKFRTMCVGTPADQHRDYIRSTVRADSAPHTNGIYKLDRGAAVTRTGRWLRRTSLDELPQLLNVLRGEMSLVGPRPCLEYETEHFAPHHFERFKVPPGMTGLWQVTARAHSTFGEALDMDVMYVRNWSLGLDVRLLMRTPRQVIAQRARTV